MKILLFDNAQMISRNGRLYCVLGTGKFAKELVGLGNEVTMFGQKIEDSASIADFDIESNGIDTISLWRSRCKILNYLRLYWKALIAASKSDFVYFFYPTSFKYLAILCWIIGRRYGVYIRGTVGVMDGMSKIIYKHATAVFTVSQKFTDFVNLVNPKQIAHTIKPMVDFTEKDAVVRTYQTPKQFSVLMFCRIEKEKGVEELLKAVKVLKQIGQAPFELTIAGGGGYLDNAIQLSKELCITELVHFTGQVNNQEDKKKLFLQADIYVLPTYHEGFPRTLYEAMLYGTPIITTLVGGIPSLMKDGVNCKAIEPKSIESITKGLTFAFENYELMTKYAKNGSELIVSVVNSERPSHAQDLNKAIHS